MRKNLLGQSEIKVSAVCLGTMTFGEQNTVKDTHTQLDLAVDMGINFIDTAEMYPVPPKNSTKGLSEEFIGHWQKIKSHRSSLVIATKIIGNGINFPYIREGKSHPDLKNIEAAIDASLTRLQTDYIDLYQIHWPDRETNYFGQLGFDDNTNLSSEQNITMIHETLEALQTCINQGKIRAIGISNETPWGVAQYLSGSAQNGLPKIVSIQNPYSLLNRSFEVGLSEFALRENVSLLAYSPLAMGMLTGKYAQKPWPPEARMSRFERFSRYLNTNAFKTVEKLIVLSEESGFSLVELALGFVTGKKFVTSTIIGATTMEQLRENIVACQTNLPKEIIFKLDDIHREITIPCP